MAVCELWVVMLVLDMSGAAALSHLLSRVPQTVAWLGGAGTLMTCFSLRPFVEDAVVLAPVAVWGAALGQHRA